MTVLRPSIIESALQAAVPGVDRGLQDGRADHPGLRPRRPAGVPRRSPTASIDIIPVDLVVNATIAAAAQRPEPGDPAYYTICSGARNPLSFRLLYELVREYFLAHPMEQRGRGAAKVPHLDVAGARRGSTS